VRVCKQVTERMLEELRDLFPALSQLVEAEQAWIGVTQWTSDGYPWVGPLPSQPGNYIAAGFVEGMVECFGSGRAIAQMLSGNDDPRPFNPRYLPSARGGGGGGSKVEGGA
jgi:glycine/D-amino acid oxidase-like deaminating enzyme